jgi:hypothetical protein
MDVHNPSGKLFFNLFIMQVSNKIIKKIITLFTLKIGYKMKYILLMIMTINSMCRRRIFNSWYLN